MLKRILLGASIMATTFTTAVPAFPGAFEGEEKRQRQAPAPKAARIMGEKKSKRTQDDVKGGSAKKHKVHDAHSFDEIPSLENLSLSRDGDEAGLGTLGQLPSELIAMIFSHLEAPKIVRSVSRATRDIVDAHVPIKVTTHKGGAFLAGMPGNESFTMNKRVALHGWVEDLGALKSTFPPGTVFKGGELFFMDSAQLDHLPPGASATLTLKTQHEVDEIMKKGLPPGVTARSLETVWQHYLTTPYIQSLPDPHKELLHQCEEDFAFFLALEGGEAILTHYLRFLLSGKEPILGDATDVDETVERALTSMELLGSDAHKATLFSTLKPGLALGPDGPLLIWAMGLTLPLATHERGLEVASFLTQDMIDLTRTHRGIDYFALQQLIQDLALEEHGRLRFLLEHMDYKHLLAINTTGLSPFFILKSLADPETGDIGACLRTLNLLDKNTFKIFTEKTHGIVQEDREAVSRVFKSISAFESHKVRREVLEYLSIVREQFPGDFEEAMLAVLHAPNTRGYKLIHAMNMAALSKETQDPLWPVLIISELLGLEDGSQALMIAPFLQGGLSRILGSLPLVVDGQVSPTAQGTMKDIFAQLSRAPDALVRNRLAHTTLPHLFDVTRGLAPQTERAPLTMGLWQTLSHIQDGAIRDHTALLIDRAFLRVFISKGQLDSASLGRVVARLALIKEPGARKELVERLKKAALLSKTEKVQI
ncbi:MAG: F-box protein [Proteobacteria bacterium]|nr:F-box protein [Pseudomonadota bacterium]